MNDILTVIPVRWAFKKDRHLPEMTQGRNWPWTPGLGPQAPFIPLLSVSPGFGAGRWGCSSREGRAALQVSDR